MPPVQCRSLYIHIPFCRSKCAYCDFFSIPRGEVPDGYVDALLSEIRFHRECMHTGPLETVYFGGGTPGLLSFRQLERIMAQILPQCVPGAEITLEVNPENVTAELLRCAAGSGINRFSVGIQSLDDRVLRAVNRNATAAVSLGALELLAASGMVFSADMIAGLPEQRDRDFVQGLQRIMSFRPSHVSLYALTVAEHTPLAQQIRRGSVRYSDARIDRQWITGRNILEAGGYLQYEVSNFALPGKESRHNSVYWQQKPYTGAGAGASGTWYFIQPEQKNSMKTDTGIYTGGKRVSAETNEALDKTSGKNCSCGRMTGGFRYTNTVDVDAYTAFWKKVTGNRPVYSGGNPVCMKEETADVCFTDTYGQTAGFCGNVMDPGVGQGTGLRSDAEQKGCRFCRGTTAGDCAAAITPGTGVSYCMEHGVGTRAGHVMASEAGNTVPDDSMCSGWRRCGTVEPAASLKSVASKYCGVCDVSGGCGDCGARGAVVAAEGTVPVNTAEAVVSLEGAETAAVSAGTVAASWHDAGIPAETELLDTDTLAFEYCMLGLRTTHGISSGEYACRFGRNLDPAVFEQYCRRGWVRIQQVPDGIRYAMTRKGILMLNTFLSLLPV